MLSVEISTFRSESSGFRWNSWGRVKTSCSFLNQFELCSKVLPLWRSEVKYFSHHWLFWTLCIFLHENNTKQDDLNIFRKVREGATIIVLWKIWPKEGSTYLKRDTDTDRLQKSVYIHTFVLTLVESGPFHWNPAHRSHGHAAVHLQHDHPSWFSVSAPPCITNLILIQLPLTTTT